MISWPNDARIGCLAPRRLARRENTKQVLWQVLADRFQMFGRIASEKQSSALCDQLIAFEFAVKLLDDLGVEFRMKTGRHVYPSPLLDTRLSSCFRGFKDVT
jgi:hypothetical protein